MAQAAKPVQLKPETLAAFDTYIHGAETEAEQNLLSGGPFLWSDIADDRDQKIRRGQIVAQFWSGPGPVKAPHGLIHDWVGAAFIPGTTVVDTLALIQDYDNHKKTYAPEVMASKLISHQGNDFQIYLRLLKKKIITVVLDTEHDVHYRYLDGSRWLCRSHSTRVAEVQNAGNSNEM